MTLDFRYIYPKQSERQSDFTLQLYITKLSLDVDET